MKRVQALPIEVQEVIKAVLEVLDSEYGSNGDKYVDDGGYVIVVESIEEVSCVDGKVYINSLVLCNNDYSISLIMPFEIMPKNLLKQI